VGFEADHPGVLAAVAARFAAHPGLRAKAALRVIPKILGPTDWVEGPGDDAAAIPDAGGYLLAAAEAILPPLVEADPFGAGVAAVVANVNDIAAMGGRVLALADTVVGPEAAVAEVLRGMRSACDLYGTRLVGGHLSVRDGRAQVSAFALGRAARLLSSRNVEVGQALLGAYCLEGRLREDFPFFSSVARRGGELAGDVAVLASVAEGGHGAAAKDVSMAGTLGSLAMLLEATGTGAVVDLEAIPRPPGVGLDPWLFAFPTYGFLLAAAPGEADACRQAFLRRGLACEIIGAVEPDGRLRVRLGDEEAVLLDLGADAVTGLGSAPQP
jgi:selenophosphate synthetase-related protein